MEFIGDLSTSLEEGKPTAPKTPLARVPEQGGAIRNGDRKVRAWLSWAIALEATALLMVILLVVFGVPGQPAPPPAVAQFSAEPDSTQRARSSLRRWQASGVARPGASSNPWQKFIEVSGLRLVEDPKSKGKILAKFIVINHSQGDLTGLAGNVTLWASTKRSEEDAQGTFSFITDVPAYGSKEVTTTLTTKLKVYELPDWQNVTADLQITAPSSGGSGGLP